VVVHEGARRRYSSCKLTWASQAPQKTLQATGKLTQLGTKSYSNVISNIHCFLTIIVINMHDLSNDDNNLF